jgi:hypothetical protein
VGELVEVSRGVPLDATRRLREGRVFRVALAFRIFDAATICIARVICAVLVMDLMRLRSSRGLSMFHQSGFISRSA